jgi:hypothetical protein
VERPAVLVARKITTPWNGCIKAIKERILLVFLKAKKRPIYMTPTSNKIVISNKFRPSN